MPDWLGNSGNGIVQTRYLFHVIPQDKQNHINIINTIAFIAAGISPVIAGMCLMLFKKTDLKVGDYNIDNYQIFFFLNAILFMVPHFLRKRVRIQKEKPTRDVVHAIIKPLQGILGPFASMIYVLRKKK
jgi:hypothetical protein